MSSNHKNIYRFDKPHNSLSILFNDHSTMSLILIVEMSKETSKKVQNTRLKKDTISKIEKNCLTTFGWRLSHTNALNTKSQPHHVSDKSANVHAIFKMVWANVN